MHLWCHFFICQCQAMKQSDPIFASCFAWWARGSRQCWMGSKVQICVTQRPATLGVFNISIIDILALSIMISRLCLKISILIRWLIRNFMKEDFRKLIYWYKKSRIDIEGHFGWTSFCSVLGVGLILIFGISELCKYLLTIKSMLMITFLKRSISLLFFKAILENIDIDEKILKNIDIEEKVLILANGSPLCNPHTCCSLDQSGPHFSLLASFDQATGHKSTSWSARGLRRWFGQHK